MTLNHWTESSALPNILDLDFVVGKNISQKIQTTVKEEREETHAHKVRVYSGLGREGSLNLLTQSQKEVRERKLAQGHKKGQKSTPTD